MASGNAATSASGDSRRGSLAGIVIDLPAGYAPATGQVVIGPTRPVTPTEEDLYVLDVTLGPRGEKMMAGPFKTFSEALAAKDRLRFRIKTFLDFAIVPESQLAHYEGLEQAASCVTPPKPYWEIYSRK